jgi:hypothetical protein
MYSSTWVLKNCGKATWGNYQWLITITVCFTISLGINEFGHNDENLRGAESTRNVTKFN